MIPISEITPFGPLYKIPKSSLKRLFWSKQSIYIHYMKRLLRILFGLPLAPIPMLLATYVWMWSDDGESWIDSVGTMTWYLASGQWDKLPE